MEYLNTPTGTTAVGLAYGPNVPDFIAAHPGSVDYVELPFEQLRHAPPACRSRGSCRPPTSRWTR
jgi:hypothetical protein